MNHASFRPTPLSELFSAEDFKLQMRFTRSDPAVFFGPTEAHAALVTERRRWLQASPATYAALLPEGEPLLAECERLAGEWHGFPAPNDPSASARGRALGGFWEPDFLLLKPQADGEIRLLGGCLCFPSHWRLTDKVGKKIEFIHSPVPGLNASLAPAIRKFLAGIKPGVASQRVNWGLSRSPELNQHPDRILPDLDAGVRLDEVWLRVEEQVLAALPESGGILFGIRVVNHPLAALRAEAATAKHFCRALETMPEGMAHYKKIAGSRERIVELLRA